MEQKMPISEFDKDKIPAVFHPLLMGAAVYDVSSSREAQVLFIDKDEGYFLKTAPRGSLKREAEMTRYFDEKRLGPEVFSYICGERDWLLTGRVSGETACHPLYLADPKKLCDTMAETLRMLHGTDHTGCPVPDRTKDYLSAAAHGRQAGGYERSMLPAAWRGMPPQEAWRIVEEKRRLLRADTLIHGDYCLPNIVLKNWRFSGFIDLDCAGVGDRHVDLFWGVWTLWFNLKTEKYGQRFLDAYGRSEVDHERLRLTAVIEAFG